MELVRVRQNMKRMKHLKTYQIFESEKGMKLKSIWNDPEFRETRERLVFPRGYEGEMDLLGDLSDVGL